MIVSPGTAMTDGLRVQRHLAALIDTEPGLPYSIRYLFSRKGGGDEKMIVLTSGYPFREL